MSMERQPNLEMQPGFRLTIDKKIEPDMVDTLNQLKVKNYVGFVGGSDLQKIQEQLGKEYALSFDYLFSENGLLSLQNGKEFHKKNLAQHLGEDVLQKFINFALRELSQIEIPCKRGTFIEYRNGMLNISPIGRNCSQSERDDFEKYDKEHKVREKLIQKFQAQFPDLKLKYSIGGQISFDVFPQGWDKSYCLQFLTEFKEIYFFGDKTFEGGNDYEIYVDSRTKGYSVKNPLETIEKLKELFLQS